VLIGVVVVVGHFTSTAMSAPSNYLLAAVNILGGCIYGYNQGVLASTIPMLQNNFYMSSLMLGAFPSASVLGAMFGSLGGGPLGDRFGRKISLVSHFTLYLFYSMLSMMF